MAAILAPAGAQASTPMPPIRTWRQLVSHRIARLSGKDIGEACDCDHTTASRIASGERGTTIDGLCNLLERAGLKVVSADKLCVSRDQFEFMRQTTARAIAHADIARTLFEDPE